MRTLGPLVLAVALLALPALGAPRAVPPASPVDASTARARTDASAALPHTARGFPLRGAGAFLLTAQQREEMARRWAISWHPARSGVVVFCPRWARAMSNLVSSHGSPWDHDTHIPLIFHGPGHIRPGLYRAAVRPVDIFPTLSRLLHRQLDPTLPGRVLSEALVDAARPPRVILTVVLDQVSHTVLKENLQSLPVLAGLIAHGARFDSCRVDFLPSLTAPFHAVMATGRYPRDTGIVADSTFYKTDDRFRPVAVVGDSSVLLVPSLMELWHRENHHRPKVISISQIPYASVLVAGRRGPEAFGRKKIGLYWDRTVERWKAHPRCFRLPLSVTGLDLAGTLGPIPPSWMGHRLDTPQERSRWPDFALFVGRTLERVLDGERVGVGEGPTDLVHVTFKETDLMGHAYGYPTPEFSRALRLVDEALGRIVEKLRAVVGADRLVVGVMADHGSLPLTLVRRAPVVKDQELEKWLLERLPVRPGHRRWLRKITGFQVFVDPDALQENRISPAEIACVLEQHPMVHSAFVGSALPKTRSDPR